MQASGDGNSKKTAKNIAAASMVILLDNWQKKHQAKPKISPSEQHRNTQRIKRASPNENVSKKRKPNNVIKEVKEVIEINTSGISDSSNDDEGADSPVSRLLRMQQAAKKPDPIYHVIDERGQKKAKEFVFEVECNGLKAQGVGPNKKFAKRMAAKNYLIITGIDKEPTDNPIIKPSNIVKKLNFKPVQQTKETSSASGSTEHDLSRLMKKMSKSKSL